MKPLVHKQNGNFAKGRRIEKGDEPTERQRAILAFIVEFTRDFGGAPSLREVGRKFGITSTNGVVDNYRPLEARGLLERDPLKSRAVRVTDAGWRALGLDVCSHCAGTGRVDARRERAQGAA